MSWFHNNKTLKHNFGISVTKVGSKGSSITLESIREEHAGTYTCEAKNRAGLAQYSAILSVNGISSMLYLLEKKKEHATVFCFPAIPQILPFNFGEDSVNSGDVASVQCTVFKGDLPINITWFHNSKLVSYGEGIIISHVSKKVSSLTIDDVRGEHAGNYTCVAQNSAGISIETAQLNINGIKIITVV